MMLLFENNFLQPKSNDLWGEEKKVSIEAEDLQESFDELKAF